MGERLVVIKKDLNFVGSYGCLGHGNQDLCRVPTKVQSLQSVKIVKAAAGG